MVFFGVFSRHSVAAILVSLPLPILLAKEQECGMPYIVQSLKNHTTSTGLTRFVGDGL